MVVLYQALSPLAWAQREFAEAGLGDARLNHRLVKVAAAMAADPSGSIPRQTQSWKDAKGAYRLFDHPRATFDSMSQAHWRQTRQACLKASVVLWVQDTTWLDYSKHPATRGLGWHGPGPKGGSGLFLHSVLGVMPGSSGQGQVLGLGWGRMFKRTGEAVNGDQARRSRRRRSVDRESLRWTEAVKQIGPAPAGSVWLHVGDREADIFELYEQTQALSGVGFVVRVHQDRNALAGHATAARLNVRERKSTSLLELMRAMAELGEKSLWIGGRGGRAGRWAKLKVCAAAVTLYSPQLHRTGRALRCWAVRVWEADPPRGVEAIEWLLLSSQPATCLNEALQITEYYSLRWLIEQYHQCLKSGCGVEQRQLETATRLEPLIGMLSVVAVRLLQLSNDARLTPRKPAGQCVPLELIQTLGRLLKVPASSLTVAGFTREVAKLGGFLARKSDGDPGWRTLWRGWQQLSLIHAGYQLAWEEKRCG